LFEIVIITKTQSTINKEAIEQYLHNNNNNNTMIITMQMKMLHQNFMTLGLLKYCQNSQLIDVCFCFRFAANFEQRQMRDAALAEAGNSLPVKNVSCFFFIS
jgi:hypothetical protein